MQLGSVRELKQEIDEELRRRNDSTEKVAYRVTGLGDVFVREVFRPPLAKGIVRIGPRDFALTVRVYAGRDRPAMRALKRLSKHEREVRVARDVTYRPRALVANPVLTAGDSIGHYQITAGTLGAFVQDAEGVYILSNTHVLTSRDANPYDPILLPGPADAVGPAWVVANLERWLPLMRDRPDSLDAAVARLSEGTQYQYGCVEGVGDVSSEPIEQRFNVQRVFKRGRSTKLTEGVVTAFELDDVMVNYGTAARPHWIQFDNQLEFMSSHARVGTKFSKPGDSGSVIYDASTRRPYSLLFAGGPDANGNDRTLGHFLPDVLEALEVEMV
jgi:hypothetical protein